jgi:nucleobase:cation symporter-1, NCS1 family
VLCAGLALWGPLGVTRVWLERFGVWVVVAISLAITVLVLSSDNLGAVLGAPGQGGFPTWGPALDLVIAMPISWLPLVADFNRYARGGRAAFLGTGVGYLIANVWLYALGAALVLTQGASPSPAGIASGILAVAGGSVAGLVFLVGLLVGETDEAFADIYSGAVSLKNIFPELPQTAFVLGISVIGTALAAWLTMERFESFLFLLGSVFVPLFGILIADHFIVRRRIIDVQHLYGTSGPYWFRGGIRVVAFVPWVAGFLLYHWVVPTGPASWIHGVQAIVGTPLSVRLPWLAASLPSFGVAFLLTLAVARISSRRRVLIEGAL